MACWPWEGQKETSIIQLNLHIIVCIKLIHIHTLRGHRNLTKYVWSLQSKLQRKMKIFSTFCGLINFIFIFKDTAYTKSWYSIRWFLFQPAKSPEFQHVSFRSTCRLFQIAYEGDFWSLCTRTFWQKVYIINSNML